MSVRLTLRLRAEQECIVNCLTKTEHGWDVTLELSDHNVAVCNASIGHSDGATGGEEYPNNAVDHTEGRDVLKVQKGRAMIGRDWDGYNGQIGLVGHSQTPSQQT